MSRSAVKCMGLSDPSSGTTGFYGTYFFRVQQSAYHLECSTLHCFYRKHYENFLQIFFLPVGTVHSITAILHTPIYLRQSFTVECHNMLFYVNFCAHTLKRYMWQWKDRCDEVHHFMHDSWRTRVPFQTLKHSWMWVTLCMYNKKCQTRTRKCNNTHRMMSKLRNVSF